MNYLQIYSRVFLNTKPWVNQEIHNLFRARSVVFSTGNPEIYIKCSYDLLKIVTRVKRQDRTNLESQTDAGQLWQSSYTVTSYRRYQVAEGESK